jgi:hypothetical protein
MALCATFGHSALSAYPYHIHFEGPANSELDTEHDDEDGPSSFNTHEDGVWFLFLICSDIL